VITVRPHGERGRSRLTWLDSRHSFAFGDYADPEHMGFSVLRVINEDRIAPGGGFPEHGHRDMEIITYVLEGELAHRDSTGNSEVIRAGEFQRMSAGSGIAHSEYNASGTDPVHLLQIWIFPATKGLTPSYEQRSVGRERSGTALQLVASPDGQDGTLTIHQDARLYLVRLRQGEQTAHDIGAGRRVYAQVTNGKVELNAHRLGAGDGAALVREPQVVLNAIAPAELLLFDLP
jgi:redox-sensitive bicupin YhaK (pirin superfamily)